MEWRSLLAAALRKHGLTQVALDLGYAKSSISLASNGRYPGGTERIEAKVLEIYGRIQCPHLGEALTPAACATHRSRPVPTSNTAGLRHWKACRECAHNPEQP